MYADRANAGAVMPDKDTTCLQAADDKLCDFPSLPLTWSHAEHAMLHGAYAPVHLLLPSSHASNQPHAHAEQNASHERSHLQVRLIPVRLAWHAVLLSLQAR